jgi:hypothetical protein
MTISVKKEIISKLKKSWTMFVVYLGALGGILESQLHFMDSVAEEYRAWLWGGALSIIAIARVKGIVSDSKKLVAARKAPAEINPPESGGEI